MKTTITKKQMEIVAKYEPKFAKGTEEGSFYGNKKACAYAFCGGKGKYDEKLYKLGQKAYMEAYDNDETWEKLNGVKPSKTARGASRNTKNTNTPKSLEAKLDKILEMLSK